MQDFCARVSFVTKARDPKTYLFLQVVSQVMRVVDLVRVECTMLGNGTLDLNVRIIRPWEPTIVDEAPPTHFWRKGPEARDLPTAIRLELRGTLNVDDLKEDVLKQPATSIPIGYRSADGIWFGKGNSVRAMQLLDARELQRVQQQLQEELKPLHDVLFGWRPPTGTGAAVENATADTKIILKKLGSMDAKVSEVLMLSRRQMRMIEKIWSSVRDGEEDLKQLKTSLKGILDQVAAIKRLVGESDNWPRFAFVVDGEKGGLLRLVTDVFAHDSVLHLLCDGKTAGDVHHVPGQQGHTFRVTREWAQKAAPWLSWSLFIVGVALKAGIKAFLPGLEKVIPEAEAFLGDGTPAWSKELTKSFAEAIVGAMNVGDPESVGDFVGSSAEKLVDSAQEAYDKQLQLGPLRGLGAMQSGVQSSGLAASEAMRQFGPAAFPGQSRSKRSLGWRKSGSFRGGSTVV
jgi:hypothetical protein